MNLTELRDFVHRQTQTTSGDLADTTIDWYLQQAFERTINGETLWPFLESQWPLTLAAGQFQMTLPGNVNEAGIMTLFDSDRGVRMEMVGQEWAEGQFVGRPTWNGTEWEGDSVPLAPQLWYSLWGGQITLWPITVSADTERQFLLRGYRRVLDWLTSAQEPDCDVRLHQCLVHYAVALAYAQQEDDVLETTYMDRWQRDVELARRAIMEPRHQRPLIAAGSIDQFVVGGHYWRLVPPTP